MIKIDLSALVGRRRTIAIVGGQWGDEGKGKIVDLVAEGWADIVARGTGGANAGHTINANGQQLILHLIPSGILHDGKGVTTICGNGMVIDPRALIEELDLLQRNGLSYNNLRVAYNASLVLPQHLVLDQIRELRLDGQKIGTTGRGISPAYVDNIARLKLTLNDLRQAEVFERKLRKNLDEKVLLLRSFDQKRVKALVDRIDPTGQLYSPEEIFNVEWIVDSYCGYGQRLAGIIADTDQLVRDAVGRKNILLEGAQGELLGIDSGTYPFVTSADCSISGLAKGVGLTESQVEGRIIVAKAPYMTRVGAGPFPTELGGEASETWCNQSTTTAEVELAAFPNASVNSEDPFEQGIGIRQAGGEYGATTRRPRRTGWLDLPLLRYTIKRTNGVLALTKTDVLDQCQVIRICVRYRYVGPGVQLGDRIINPGDQFDVADMEEAVLRQCEPIYQDFPGWLCPTSHIRDFDALPQPLIDLVKFISSAAGCFRRVSLMSIGPDRDQTIVVSR